MPPKITWDAELYEARHGFVWQFGEALLDMLHPMPGERILDLGCGPGHLTHRIAACGAQVIGLDASPEMIGLARQNYPELQFVLEDAARMQFHDEFDAVFSNAALHWMLDATGVARAVSRAMRMGGRFVAEMGGKGNIRQIESAVEKVARRYLGPRVPDRRTFFPSVAEYAAVLESSDLEVQLARLFNRPTELEGQKGMENWVRQFKSYCFENLPAAEREHAFSEVIEELRPTLFQEGKWMADYRRLQIIAVKPAHPGTREG
jgi:trans-aconitate 2-methyltransferase